MTAGVFALLRSRILAGEFAPGEPLKAQRLADEYHVSLAVVREALSRLNGEELTDRVQNRGFAVPSLSYARWHQAIDARLIFEPAALRLSIERGNAAWESSVARAHGDLVAARESARRSGAPLSQQWHSAHQAFHRALLAGSRNDVVLDFLDRLWLTSAPFRHWFTDATQMEAFASQHAALARAALARDAETAMALLVVHIRSAKTMIDR